MNKVKFSTNPYNINRLTQLIGLAVLENDGYYMNCCREIVKTREKTVEDLRNNQKNKGLSYFSIPRNRAYNELYELIEKNPQFSSWCNYYVELDDGTQY